MFWLHPLADVVLVTGHVGDRESQGRGEERLGDIEVNEFFALFFFFLLRN